MPSLTYLGSKRWMASIKPLFFLTFWLFGCGERPPFPQWPQSSPTAIEQIVLSDKLTAKDLRQIATALNKQGQLTALGPWLERLTDTDLNEIGTWLTDYIFQDALSKGSAIDLLEHRIDTGFFKSFSNGLMAIHNNDNARALFPSLFKLVQQPEFATVLEQNAHWLDPHWSTHFKKSIEEEEDGGDISESEPSSKPDNDLSLISELHQLLIHSELKNEWNDIAKSIQGSSFFSNTWKYAQQNISQEGKTSSVQSLQNALRRMAHTQYGTGQISELEALVGAINALNGPTDGFFIRLQQTLLKPGIARELGNLLQPNKIDSESPFSKIFDFQPFVSNSIAKHIARAISSGSDGAFRFNKDFWKNLNDNAPQAITNLSVALRLGIQDITGAALPLQKRGATDFNTPIYINGLVLTEWLLSVAKSNPRLGEKLSDKTFAKTAWGLPISSEKFDIFLTDAEGNLLTSTKDKIRAMFSEESDEEVAAWTKGIERSLKSRFVGEWKFSFPKFNSIPLEEALQKSVLECDKTLSFADPSSLVRIGLFLFTEKDSSGKSLLQRLEGPNFLNILNKQLMSLSEGAFSPFVQNGKSERTVILNWVREFHELLEKDAEGNLPQRIHEIFNAFETIFTILSKPLEKDATGPHPIIFYIGWLRSIGENDLSVVSQVISLLNEGRVLGTNFSNTTVYRFPAIMSILVGSSEDQANKSLNLSSLMKWSPTLILKFENGIRESLLSLNSIPKERDYLNANPMDLYIHWLSSVSSEETTSWNALFSVMQTGLSPTPAEKVWLKRVIDDGGMRRFLKWALKGFSGGSATGILKELLRMSEKQIFTGPLDLFEQIQNERTKRIAQVLKKFNSISKDRSKNEEPTSQLTDFLKMLDVALEKKNDKK